MTSATDKKANLLVLKLFWSYWMRFPRTFMGCLLMGPGFALQQIIAPLFVTIGINRLIQHQTVPTSTLLLASASLLVAGILGYIINRKFEIALEYKMETAMYQDLFRYLVNQDYNFYADNFSGSLVTRANRLVKAYALFHLTFFLDIQGQFWVVLISLAIMAHYSLGLALVVTAIWLICLAVIVMLVIRRIPLRLAGVAKDTQQTGELADMVSNAIAVKTFAAETHEIERYQKVNAERAKIMLKSWQVAVRNGWLTESMCAALQITVFIGGVYLVQKHGLPVATFLLFQLYIIRIVDSLRKSSLIVRQIEGVLSDGQEMAELLLSPPLIQDMPEAKELVVTQAVIELRSISFNYGSPDNNQQPLFNGLDLKLVSGEKIGLVGPSGGGKTTITKLLLRFVDINGGQLLIDGQDIREVTQASLRQSIAYVPQEPLLFHRSIFENIAYGKPGASVAEVREAAHKANALTFIDALPHGFDTIVGERGVKLSGGQRQRVAIARAILKNAPILVLDEATSALDSESEVAIQSALQELMKGRTTLVIAHRLSTIQRLDRIIVLDEGAIVENGSHQSLLKHKGLYSRLWAHQSGGFIED
jgi:ATP-binding cassette subfamily B protein